MSKGNHYNYILLLYIAVPLIPVIISVAINPHFYVTNNTEVIVENSTTNATINIVPGL